MKSINSLYKSLQHKLIGIKYLNRWIILFIDVSISMVATALAIVFARYTVGFNNDTINIYLIIVYLSLLYSSLGFLLFKVYKDIVRFSTVVSILKILGALLIKFVLLSTSLCLVDEISINQLFLITISDLLLSFIFISFFRLIGAFLYQYLLNSFQKVKYKVLIYGLDDNNIAIASILNLSTHSEYQIAGFINKNKTTRYNTGNIPAFYIDSEEELENTIDKYDIKGILFASRTDIIKGRNIFIKYAMKHDIKLFTIPSIENWQHSPNNLSNISIEDILDRAEINVSIEEIIKNIKGKIVFVSGAAGSIGSRLSKLIAGFGVKQLILFDSCETGLHNLRLELNEEFPLLTFAPIIGDIRLLERVEFIFQKYKPDIVFHAAAYKHVPLMEENPCEAIFVNSIGSKNIADVALKHNVEKFIMISTDKAVNPTSVMGASKRLAEIYVQSLNSAIQNKNIHGTTKFITTRFGNVLGSQGSVIPRFKSQIEKGGPVTVTHPEITRYFMSIKEACLLVLEASTLGNGGEIFVFEMGDAVKIIDIAKKMIALSSFKNTEIKYTGLRPGEKLYEELLNDKETTLPTPNVKIRIAKVREYEYEEINKVLLELIPMLRCINVDYTISTLKAIIPEYISENSVFEKFDKKEEA